MYELMMSIACGSLVYLLVMQIVQCFTLGFTGISEDDAEDEPPKNKPAPFADGTDKSSANEFNDNIITDNFSGFNTHNKNFYKMGGKM